MFKSLSKLNVLKTPKVLDHQVILDFKRPNEIAKCITRSDQELGGFSTVNLEIDPQENTGHFHGYLNLDPPKNRPEITQSGYAMFRTRDQPQRFLLGDTFWDWSNFNQLVMRVKGDHRKYFVNIQADAALTTDIYQHRLFLNTPGEYETVVISLDDFILTNWGVIQDDTVLDKGKVKTVGIGLLDRQFGSYSLHVDWIKVMTGESLKKTVEESRRGEDEFGFEGSVV